jgi:F-type H+-transporting ATPase subunit b
MDINLYTVAFTIVNFIILYLFLRKFLFNRVQNFMISRSNAVEENISTAKKNVEESTNLKKEIKIKLQDAQVEGRRIVDEYKSRANTLSDEIVSEAKKEAEGILERARVDSEREKEKAKSEIKEQIVALSLLVASKYIKAQLDEKRHHEMINDFINEVGI